MTSEIRKITLAPNTSSPHGTIFFFYLLHSLGGAKYFCAVSTDWRSVVFVLFVHESDTNASPEFLEQVGAVSATNQLVVS